MAPTRQPARTIDSDDYSMTKTCPGCHGRKPLTTDHWYTRNVWRTIDGERQRVNRATSYCRVCSNAKRSADRHRQNMMNRLPDDLRDELRDHQRGPCDCCGKTVTNRTRVVDWGIFCRHCYRALDDCNFVLDTARQRWFSLCAHITSERELDRSWRSDRKRPSDHRHWDCLLNEAALRMVVNWLDTHGLQTA